MNKEQRAKFCPANSASFCNPANLVIVLNCTGVEQPNRDNNENKNVSARRTAEQTPAGPKTLRNHAH